MPVHTYTNWNSRPSDNEEQIEPFRKYFFICEGANTETFYFKRLIDLRKQLGIHPLIDIRLWEKTDEDRNLSFAKNLADFAESQKNIPDNDFAADEDYPWCIGQFVWTGFDYLGEPSPYDTDAWPNHSSVFGIVDLAYIPKDRFYLYRSQWNQNDETLHILPHWNWEGREGEVTPVFVYTSYPSAELFVNGVSQGIRTFAKPDGNVPCLGEDAMKRFRLMWDDVTYEPGEIKVIAYDSEGQAAAEKSIRTAGKAAEIKLTPDRKVLKADGEDLCYINVSLTDKEGNPVPTDNRLVKVKVTGNGSFKAIANGDPTCLESFQQPQMHLFSGQLTVLVQSSSQPGEISVEVTGKGVKKAQLTIKTE
jgi:beta-galactosidase